MQPLVVVNEQEPILQAGPGSRARVLAAASKGARHMAVAERWLDPGAEVAVHTHPESVEEVVWIAAGSAEFRVGDETEVVGADCTVVIPPLTPHGFTALGDEPLHVFSRWSAAVPVTVAEDGGEGPPEVPGTL